MNLSRLLITGFTAVVLTVPAPAQDSGVVQNRQPLNVTMIRMKTLGYTAKEFAQVERRYADCLQSGNDGVVESSLAHVAMLKLAYPDSGFQVMESGVASVAEVYPSLEIRYKAYLVGTLLRNPGIFSATSDREFSSTDAIFEGLGLRLQEMIAGNVAR